MKQIKARLSIIITYISSFIPERVPLTLEAHEAWASKIIVLGAFPDNKSFRSAVASMILHLPSEQMYVSKRYIINKLNRSIANQISFNIVQDAKNEK